MKRFAVVMLLFCVGLINARTTVCAERTVREFYGVMPGSSTEAELRASEKWGQPTAASKDAQRGATRLVYEIKPWEEVAVTVQQGLVKAINFVPPAAYLDPAKLGSALKLGGLQRLESLPKEADTGVQLKRGWTIYESTDIWAVMFVEPLAGKEEVRIMRFYDPQQPVTSGSAGRSAPSSAPPAAPPPAPVPGGAAGDTGKSEPSDKKHGQIAKVIVQLIEQHHVSGHPVDDEIAKRMVEQLLKYFDPNKVYFMQADVDRFRRAGTNLADQLRQGDVRLGQEILDTYVERMGERRRLLEELLDAEHDLTADETRVIRGDELVFARSDAEVREQWRQLAKYQLLVHRAAGTDMIEARRRALRMYHSRFDQIEQYGAWDALNALLDSFLTSYDPHSAYWPPVEAVNQEIDLRQQLFGIGAVLKVREGYTTIQRIVPDGPAAKDGQLKEGDRILAIGEGKEGELVDVVGARLANVVNRIRGEGGSVVRLKVLPPGRFESTIYSITRGEVKVTSLAATILAGDSLPEGRQAKIGYVYLTKFFVDRKAKAEGRDDYRSSTRDLERHLKEFSAEGVDCVLLDLRANGGGVFSEAIEMTGLFVEGPVAQVKDGKGKIQVYTPQSSKVAWNGPLVVLTSTISAGGSEIFAGAIADYRRGLMIGDPQTHGMGTSQGLIALGPRLFNVPNPPDLGTLKLTNHKFYRVSGDSTQLRGVVPHVVLPARTSVSAVEEGANPYALAYDSIPAADYAALDSPVDAEMEQLLNARSKARRQDSAYFRQLAAKIEQDKEKSERTRISLREADFLAERKEDEWDQDWPKVPGIADVKIDPYLKEAMAISLDYAAHDRYARAEKLYTDREFADAINQYRRAVVADPDFADGHYMLAWVLATCPDDAHRDGTTATKHAKRACELAGEVPWHYLLCLSIAEAEAGDFDSARKHLSQTLDLAPDKQRESYKYLIDRFESGETFE